MVVLEINTTQYWECDAYRSQTSTVLIWGLIFPLAFFRLNLKISQIVEMKISFGAITRVFYVRVISTAFFHLFFGYIKPTTNYLVYLLKAGVNASKQLFIEKLLVVP